MVDHLPRYAGCLQIIVLALGVACGIFWLSRLSSVGRTPSTDLLGAAFSGDEKAVRQALEQGADANFMAPRFGFTPLLYAVCRDHPALAALLIERGADVNAKTDGERHRGQAPLHAAAEVGSVELVQLLLAEGTDVDIRDRQGETPLYLAVKKKRAVVVPLLVAGGADPNLPANNGDTPYALARRMKQQDLLP